MRTDYEHYVLGCREYGVRPLGAWRFNIAYAKYNRDFQQQLEQDWDSLSPQQRHHLVVQSRWLTKLAHLVRLGREVAEAADRRGDNDDGAAGAGTREPCTPRTPVLAGSAARPLPQNDALKEPFPWRL